MPAAFGLLSLLITICLILYLMVGVGGGGGYLGGVAKANKSMKSQVNVIGGYDPNRQMLATDSIHMHIDRGPSNSGKPKLLVTEVMASGPMDEHFGLKAKDQIVEIGSLDVDANVSTIDDGTAFMHDAYARGWPIVVIRNGQRVQLPTAEHIAAVAEHDRKAALAAAASNGTPPPVAGATTQPVEETSALDRALDSIRSSPK